MHTTTTFSEFIVYAGARKDVVSYEHFTEFI
jgi:hypothetical protein